MWQSVQGKAPSGAYNMFIDKNNEDLCQFLAAVHLGERAPATQIGPFVTPDRHHNVNAQSNDAEPRNNVAQPHPVTHTHSQNHSPVHSVPIMAPNPTRNPVVQLYPNVLSASNNNTSIDSGSGEEVASNVEDWVEAQYQWPIFRTTRLRTYSISSTGSVLSISTIGTNPHSEGGTPCCEASPEIEAPAELKVPVELEEGLAPPCTPSPELLYNVTLGRQTGLTEQWHIAGHATQGVPGEHVFKVVIPPRTRCRHCAAYDVVPLVKGVPYNIYQGFNSRLEAERAYVVAFALGALCILPPHTHDGRVPAAIIPMPIYVMDAFAAASPLFLRAEWHVVFKGRSPRIYPAWNFAAIQTNGVSCSIYKKFVSGDLALEAWRDAVAHGETAVLR